MVRLFTILLVVAIVSLGLGWIADEPGRVTIDWANYHIETSLLVILAAIAVAALWCMVIYALLFVLIRSPRAWSRSRLAKRQMLGFSAITEAFTAIAAQDAGTAKRQIARAQQLIPHQPLTLMLSAQIARMEGNEGQANLYLEQMLKAESTEFIALRGLVESSRRSHNDNAAIKYAEKALVLKPQDTWLITMLTALYTAQGQTQNAMRLLDNSAAKRYIGKPEARKLSAYVLYENARNLMEQNRADFSIAVLEDVLRKQPGFIPANALLAVAYAKQRELKRALKVLHTAWKMHPHPALTKALLFCYDAHKEERSKIVQAGEKMAAINPDHRENQFLLAQLALKQGELRIARGHINHLMQNEETIRACQLMAELEDANNDHEQSAHWLKRAGDAIADAGWVCESCSRPHEQWHISCGHCGSIASLAWK